MRNSRNFGRRDFGKRRSREGGFERSFSNRSFSGRDLSVDRQMHKAICAECGQECEVPFKPTEGRPVFCRECFRNKKGF